MSNLGSGLCVAFIGLKIPLIEEIVGLLPNQLIESCYIWSDGIEIESSCLDRCLVAMLATACLPCSPFHVVFLKNAFFSQSDTLEPVSVPTIPRSTENQISWWLSWDRWSNFTWDYFVACSCSSFTLVVADDERVSVLRREEKILPRPVVWIYGLSMWDELVSRKRSFRPSAIFVCSRGVYICVCQNSLYSKNAWFEAFIIRIPG